MIRRLTTGDLYSMIRVVHRNLLDSAQWPDVKEMDDDYLEEIRRALFGARAAVNGYERMVVDELRSRGRVLAPVIPLRHPGFGGDI